MVGSHQTAGGAAGGALGTLVHNGRAAGAADGAALWAAAAAANVCLAARETEAAIDANNMGAQPRDAGTAAVTSTAATPSTETMRMGEQPAGVGLAGVEPVLGAAALELSSPVHPSGRVHQPNLG